MLWIQDFLLLRFSQLWAFLQERKAMYAYRCRSQLNYFLPLQQQQQEQFTFGLLFQRP